MRGWDLGWGLTAAALAAAAMGPAPAQAQVAHGAYGGGFIEYVANGGRMVGPSHAPAAVAPQMVYSAAPAYAAPQPNLVYAPQVYAPQAYVAAPARVVVRPAHPAARSTPLVAGRTLAEQNAGAVVAQPWPPRQAAYGGYPAAPEPALAYAPAVRSAAPAHVVARPGRRVALADPTQVEIVRPRRGVSSEFRRAEIDYGGPHAPGTVIVDTPSRFLYLVQPGGRALRYGIGVGRPGFEWSGVKHVTRKAHWPSWRPPAEMRKRRPDLPDFMEGGESNPLGARALYLGSSLYRIHGTNEPHTIGQNVSSGCIRMMNEDVIDLYDRVGVGTKVIVI
jgi:lipoprotein-anchoring transpeptidase ErfK/SrfK